jgi:hypothetical protein
VTTQPTIPLHIEDCCSKSDFLRVHEFGYYGLTNGKRSDNNGGNLEKEFFEVHTEIKMQASKSLHFYFQEAKNES